MEKVVLQTDESAYKISDVERVADLILNERMNALVLNNIFLLQRIQLAFQEESKQEPKSYATHEFFAQTCHIGLKLRMLDMQEGAG